MGAPSRTVLTTFALVAATAPAADAAVRALPERAVAVAPDGRCADVPWRAAPAAPRTALHASLSGARGDWDLRLLRDGREVTASHGLAAREVVSATAARGDRLVVRACRADASASRRATVRLQAVTLPAATPAAPGSLTKVKLTKAGDGDRLQRLGLDLGEDGSSGWLSVVVRGARDLDLVKGTGLPFRVVERDLAAADRRERAIERRAAAASGRSALPSGRTSYRTFADIQQELKDLAAAAPGRAATFALPLPTAQGREVPGIEIADDVERARVDGRPTFPVVAVHHAREWPAGEMAMELANDLLRSDEPEVADLLRRVRVVIVPIQNPDGFISSREGFEVEPNGTSGDETAFSLAGGIQAYRRKTCSGPLPAAAPCDLQPGADSNRNYGANWGGKGASTNPYEQDFRGDGPWSENETENVHRWLRGLNATMVLSIHNVLGAVLRPPGVSDAPVPADDEAMLALGDELSEITGYRSDTFFGGLGYDGSGLTEDFAYSELGAYTYTIEVGPSNGQFHMNYPTGVVRQWEGDPDRDIGGMRAALRRMADAAADEAGHAVLTAQGAPGTTVRVRREFTSLTGAACTAAPGILVRNSIAALECIGPTAAMGLPDHVEFTAVVPATGALRFHVPPSTRPSVVASGAQEAYAVTCERDGQAVGTAQVVVERGRQTALPAGCAG